jgi:hypothetical protein
MNNQINKNGILVLIVISIYSCGIFYSGGSNPIYIHKYKNCSKSLLDSVCTLFLFKYPEHKVTISEINKLYTKYPKSYSSPYYNEWETYLETNVYYPYAPGTMSKYYLFKSTDTSLYYIFDITKDYNYSGIQLRYVKSDSLDSRPINSHQLSKGERQIIAERFEDEIINKLDSLIKELK